MRSQVIVGTFKKANVTWSKAIQMAAKNTVAIFILNVQCKLRKKTDSAGFLFHLQRLLFKEKSKIAIKNCLTNMGKWQYKMLITRSTEPCGFGLTKWPLNDWKIQVLLSAILKCFCVSQELQQEGCSWLHKYFLWTSEIQSVSLCTQIPQEQ